jgi:predicted nucleotidyltransferase
VVSEELARLTGVEQALIFGSWAARYNGEPGPPTRDVDVLLVGAPNRDAVDDAAQRAQSRLGREVNVIIRGRDRWEHDEDAFTVQLRTSPLLLVPLGIADEPKERSDVSPRDPGQVRAGGVRKQTTRSQARG